MSSLSVKQYAQQVSHPQAIREHAAGASKIGPTVIVWDQHRSRLTHINRVIAECEANSFWMEGTPVFQEINASAHSHIALVELPSPDDLKMEVIRAFTQQGFRVICYGENAQSWPLGIRCQALLTGASWLLDSATAEFAHSLRRLLKQLLQAGSLREAEDEKMKNVMGQLGVVGESPTMISIFRWIARLSTLSDLATLITGETGTGKELFAHAIHQLDPKRRDGPFVVLNCGAINHGLAESELFGHRRGSFTGADRHRDGLIRAAQGGVLFLDEIGELDIALQTKLLRVLQENRVLGVGEDREVPVNVRIIAATNRNLKEMIQQGEFRADLFHRLNVLSVHLPPLHERPTDFRPLIGHFLIKHHALNPAHALTVDDDFIEALMQIELPGNARQLENIVRQALINKVTDAPLNLSDLPLDVWQELSAETANTTLQQKAESRAISNAKPALNISRPDLHTDLSKLLDLNGWNLSQAMDYCERLLVQSALHLSHGNQSQAAQRLGITPRSVYNKVQKHLLHHE